MRFVRTAALFIVLLSAVPGAVLGAGDLEITGRVIGAHATPLPEARVTLLPLENAYDEALRLSLGEALGPEPLAATKSDGRGRFSLAAPGAGFYRLRIEAPGYAPTERSLAPLLEARALEDAHLERESLVQVRVVGEEGEPLEGALVRARGSSWSDGWALAAQSRLTDEKGEATLARSKRERLNVSSSAMGHSARIVEESSARRLELSLASSGTRALRAVDEDDAAMEGALIVAGSPPVPLGASDESGGFLVALPGSRSLELQVLAPDGRQALVQASLSEDPEAPALRAIFQPLLTASGRVLSAEDGRPIPGALVWSSGKRDQFAITDGSGRYTLAGIVGARPNASASSPGFLQSSEELLIDGDKAYASFSLKPAAAIEGIVVDGAGTPVPDAMIEASVHREGRGRSRRARFLGGAARRFARQGASPTARASAEGRFRIGSLDPERDYEVLADAPSFATSKTLVKGLEPGRTKPDVRVVMRPGQTLRGRIVDEQGLPLAGAEIEARSSSSWGGRARRLSRDEPAGRVASSDLEGRFALQRLPTGSLDIVITRAGYAREIVPGVEMLEGEDRDLGEVELEPGRSVFGRVTDDVGAPLADASIYVLEGSARNLMRMNRPPWGVEPDAVSGADGSFIVADRRADETISLLAHRKGFTLSQRSGVEVANADAIVLELEPASRVSGVVLDEDESPVPGASVMLTKSTIGPGGRAFFSGMGGSGETDSEGRFVIENVRPDTWTLGAGGRGFLSTTRPAVEVPRGEDVEDLELTLSRGARLAGLVLEPDGSPAGDASVSIADREEGGVGAWMSFGGRAARTDAEGRFVLEGLDMGDQSVRASHADYPSLTRDVEIGEGSNSITLTFDAGLSVSGRVVDRGGAPVAGANAYLRPAGSGWRAGRAETGPDGSFVIEGMKPGEYEASASASGYSSPEETQRVTLVEGQAPAPLELVLSESAVIRGRVIGLESRDYADVRVSAASSEGRWGSSSGVDFEGAFLLEGVGPGTWTVQGRMSEGGRVANAEVTLSEGALEASVDLDFGAGLTLKGRILRAGAPVDGARVFASREGAPEGASAMTNSEGRYALSGLSPGEYLVTAMEGFGEAAVERTIVLEGDGSLDLEFPSARIAGRVVRAADRKPLVGAVVSVEHLDAEPDGWAGTGGAASDPEGRFAVEGLAAGAWRVKASLPGYAVGEEKVSITEGESRDDLTLALDPTEGLLLRVLDFMGRPVRGARVAVLDPAGLTLTSAYVEASENGTLFLESVPAGTWEVLVQSSGSALGVGNASAPGAATTLQLERPCTLHVTVADLVEAPLPAELTLVDAAGRAHRTLSWGGQTRSQHSLSAGRVTLDDLPPGTWTLTVVASDGRRWEAQAQTSPASPARISM